MNEYLMWGTRIVLLALISYSIAVITEQIKHKTNNRVIIFITFGIIFDVTSTILMIKGSSNTPWTLHGILGYSSLTAMFIDFLLIWRYRFRHGPFVEVKKGLHLYSRYAYIWWLAAFLTGGLIAMTKYM